MIERGYNAGPENSYAIIGITDNWTTWQNAVVQTDFGPNVQLHDYSGANTTDIYTDANGIANINVPPCNGSNTRKGYCIWGKANAAIAMNSPVNSITQEWEMAQDLGDSHINSLHQGGELPANSMAYRYVGEIFSDANKLITLNLYQTTSGNNVTLELRDHSGALLQTVADTGTLQLTYLPPNIGFYTMYIKNSNLANTNQPVYVKANYTAPLIANTLQYPSTPGTFTSVSNTANKQNSDILVYPTLISKSATIKFTTSKVERVKISILTIEGVELQVLFNDIATGGAQQISFENTNLTSGIYLIRMQTADKIVTTKIAIVKG